MHVKQLAATLLVLCASSLVAQGNDRGLPVVHEEVDEICVIQTQNSDHCRVVFIRGESVLATRLMVDEMLWTTHEDQFRLVWQDYWTAERIVDSKKMSVWLVDEDPTQSGQNGPWWCMFRNMRDLKQP